MPRAWVWIQLIFGWLPIWALFTLLIMAAHETSLAASTAIALRLIVTAAVLGMLVYRLTARMPWPHPFRLRFIFVHVLTAVIYALTWVALNSLVESLLSGHWFFGPRVVPFLITGVWMYVMVAGVAYANRAAIRSAQLATLEARSQLAALRAQLHPHFLFNALHTVVQLIPVDPRGAARAAEQLAEALRITLEEERDLLPLADEWRFVQRYLAIEAIRFGDRLRVQVDMQDAALVCILPAFALQTLVENAVRHAAAPRVEPTDIVISARRVDTVLELQVTDNGAGADAELVRTGHGTGLRRLRERLFWLHGAEAQLDVGNGASGGFSARLRVPQSRLRNMPSERDDA